ncbi:MAG: three-Cys-motif partner protein TcmP [Phycisphaerales bacterium]|nr:three-Cys-motif partner protein TcmP [Phycisphaerales bacterium]
MSKKLPTIWKAEPHTIAKIELLSAYLKAWFSILGTKPPRRNAELLYVDGFAGPGEYTNHPTGSPIVAVEAATSALNTHEARWRAGDIHCAFVELDAARMENLERKLKSVSFHPRVHPSTYTTSFVNGLDAIKTARPSPFSRAEPLFVFIDPFGATGAPFTAVADILRSRTSEVLINLDADGIARIFRAGDDANRGVLLTEIFGGTSWRESPSFDADFDVQCRQVLDLYKRRLRSLPGIGYVFAFEMRGKLDSINYFLVFASGHPLGLEKMKEAMKSIDQGGAYAFCDADVGQSLLFRFDDPAEFARRLFERHKGKRVPYEELRDYALNDTPFANPKRMLKWIEENDLIESVELLPGKTRCRGTFSEDAVNAVVFRQGAIHAQG